jgi:hypothetical protein
LGCLVAGLAPSPRWSHFLLCPVGGTARLPGWARPFAPSCASELPVKKLAPPEVGSFKLRNSPRFQSSELRIRRGGYRPPHGRILPSNWGVAQDSGAVFPKSSLSQEIIDFPADHFKKKKQMLLEVILLCWVVGFWGAVPRGFPGGTPRPPPGARLLSHSLIKVDSDRRIFV